MIEDIINKVPSLEAVELQNWFYDIQKFFISTNISNKDAAGNSLYPNKLEQLNKWYESVVKELELRNYKMQKICEPEPNSNQKGFLVEFEKQNRLQLMLVDPDGKAVQPPRDLDMRIKAIEMQIIKLPWH